MKISGLDRYRATLAHMVGHRRWTVAQIADNWSPFQRMAVEFFEDCRVETLLCREYPGLRRVFLALHPKPVEDACNPENTSCLRHRMAMLSRALLDPEHGYCDADLLDFVARFHALMAEGTSNTKDIAALALSYVAKTRRQSDQLARIHFADTVVDYRDDNRQMWKFIEEGDEEEAFDAKRKLEPGEELKGLPPRHYPEWDYKSLTYRPDWVSVYEALHPKGNPADIDRLLEKHSALAKRLKRILDLLKPQDKIRIRYQEEGSELDLDVAIRSLIDFKVEGYPTEKERQELTRAIADKAVECRASRILFGTDRRMVGVADAAWARTLDDLDGDTLYGMLRDDLRDKSGVVKSRGDVRTSVSWLYRTQSASRCAELESVTRGQPLHPWRGALLPFFTNKKCATETRTVAGELLASSVPEYRMDACLALRDLRDKTHLAKMRRLAETDPARSIEKERQGYWTYAFVTHPVRETCQQAVNQIELRE